MGGNDFFGLGCRAMLLSGSLRQVFRVAHAARGLASGTRLCGGARGMVRKAVTVAYEGDKGGMRSSLGSLVRGGLAHRGQGVGSAATRRLACSASAGDMGHMEPAEAFEFLDTEGWKFVDCRTEEEFAAGHVADSVNIPVVRFSDAGMVPNQSFVEELRDAVPDKETSIVMICKVGQRSMMASQLALNDQYDQVHNMTGGMMQWVGQGLPTTLD